MHTILFVHIGRGTICTVGSSEGTQQIWSWRTYYKLWPSGQNKAVANLILYV